MKTCKLPLPDNHIGIAEIDGDYVILYIGDNHHAFFGLLSWQKIVTPKEVFILSDFDEDRKFMKSVSLGRTVFKIPKVNRYRNIETFDIRVELDRMYSEYTVEKKRRDEWNKKLNNFTCI